jgi:hypothetical protein
LAVPKGWTPVARFAGAWLERQLMLRVLLPALVLLTFVIGTPRSVHAQPAIRVVSDAAVENRFPESLTFAIEIASESEIREARLRYTFIPDGRAVTAKAEFDTGKQVRATYVLRSGTSQLYVPPGKSIRYAWEITDSAGNELKTEEKETAFSDNRFRWQQVTDGVVQINYYNGTQRDAEVMAQVATETITKAGALMGAKFDFPIKVWAYASQKDFQIALAHSSVSSDPGVLGQAHAPDTFIMVVDRLSSPSALDTMRHELTHLVTARALQGGPFKDLYPSWLNEGTSVYFQVSPNDVGYVDALEDAIEEDKVVPVRLLTSLQRARDVGLFYGQSYGMVKYLIETHGAEKFGRLIAEFKQLGNEDQTFQKVYGFDRNGLYQEWRKSVGLPAEQGARSGQNDNPQASTSSAKGTSGQTIAIAVGASVALLLLLGGAVAGGLVLARRMQPADED